MSVEIHKYELGSGAQNNGVAVRVGCPAYGMEHLGVVNQIIDSTRFVLFTAEKSCLDPSGNKHEYHSLGSKDIDGTTLPYGNTLCKGCFARGSAMPAPWNWIPTVPFAEDGRHLAIAKPKDISDEDRAREHGPFPYGYETEAAALSVAESMVDWESKRYGNGPYWFAVIEYHDQGKRYDIISSDTPGHKDLDIPNAPFVEAYAGPFDSIEDAMKIRGLAELGFRDLKSVLGLTYKGFTYDLESEAV